MPISDICDLPVREIAAENALLFIWVTFPLLKEGIRVLEAWGFEYKTLGFSWIKTNPRYMVNQPTLFPDDEPVIDDFFGIGAYTKSNCEVCLIGVRGKGSQIVKNNTVRSTIIAPRQEHSRKPEVAMRRIEELVGEKSIEKVELFARRPAPGWDIWGNEVESDLTLSTPLRKDSK